MAVFGYLFGAFAAGNRTRHGIKHQNPAQRELTHGNPGRQQRSNFFYRFQSNGVFNSGKRLADIKCLAVSIEIAVVILGKRAFAIEFAGQQSARQREPEPECPLVSSLPQQKTSPRAVAENS